MARKYANLLTAIWRDEDFRALPAAAQRTYMMLLSQPDITAAGTLALTVGRWARYAVDTKPADLRTDFEVLERARFVIVDDETEELLVRTFIVWDGGANNEKRQPVIRTAAQDIASGKIRRALAEVLERLKFPARFLPDWYADSLSARASGTPSTGYPVADSGLSGDPAEPSPADSNRDGDHTANGHRYAQANRLSDSQAGNTTALDRVVVTEVSRDTSTHNPETTTHNPLTENRGRAAPTTTRPPRLGVADDDPHFAAFWSTYPRRDAKGAAREAWTRAVAKAGDPNLVIQGAARYRDWNGREDRYTKMPATWLNQECWNDELAARRARSSGNGHQPYRDDPSIDYLGDL